MPFVKAGKSLCKYNISDLVCVDVFLLEVYSKWVGGVADKGVSATISESKLLEV